MPENNGLEVTASWKGHLRWERIWHYAIVVLLGSGSVWTNHLFTNSPTRIEVNNHRAAVDEHLAKDDQALQDAQDRLSNCERVQDLLFQKISDLEREMDKKTPPARNKTRYLPPAGGIH